MKIMAGDNADLFINVKGMGWAKLQGDALKASKALKGISVTAKTTTKTLKNGSKVVTNQWSNALKTGTKAAGRFGSGLNSLAMRFVGLQAIVTMGLQKFREFHQWIGASIEKFREFENRIAEVSTILQGVSMNLLPALQIGVEQLSVTFGKSANDLTNGLYDILSAAFDAEDSIRLLNTSIKASIAGLTDVSTSVDVFTSILNAYGKTVAQAAGISDILFQTVVRGKLRFEDLASAMGYITPIAANAGVAFREIAAVLATVTRQGLHVDMASRGLALMLQGIVSPAKAAADAAQKFGVDLSGLALRVKGLEGFIGELNKASKIYGMSILPQIVRNMRSLRVAMALAGEEGVLGFAEDLNLMKEATGKTDEALTKMMNTQQRQAEILAKSFELVERKIGEAWSGVDIWWRKAKLWWATALTGGDADAAVRKVENQIANIRSAQYELIAETGRISGKKTLMEQLLGDPGEIREIILEFGELDKVKEYLNLGERITNLADVASTLEVVNDELKNFKDLIPAPEDIPSGGFFESILDPIKAASKARKEVKLTGDQINTINKILSKHGQQLLSADATYGSLVNKISKFGGTLDSVKVSIEQLTAEQNAAQPGMDYFESMFDDMTESMNNHKQNLLELKNAISELNVELVDSYTTLGGKKFTGMLKWELGVKIDETALSRFEEFTTMALKYGAEYFNEYTDETDRFGNSLEEIIMTMHNYKEIQEELNQQQQEMNDLLDENLLAIRKNNLEKMKLQLIGMIRRRGNTRTEMKMMKQLDIENLQMRIENMGKELEYEEATAEQRLQITETEYDKAKSILDRYLDEQKHGLWLLKDIRDDDIRDLENIIAYKEGLLSKYTEWYGDELSALNLEHQVYVEALTVLSEEMPDVYAKLFNTEYLDKFIKSFEEYQSLLGVGGGQTTKKETSTPALDKFIAEQVPKVISIPGAQRTLEFLGLTKSGLQIPRLHTGIESVPYEGLYHLDKGERVTPSNQKDGNIVNNIRINLNATIASDYDVERTAEAMGEAMDRKLTDKRGKSKYRLR